MEKRISPLEQKRRVGQWILAGLHCANFLPCRSHDCDRQEQEPHLIYGGALFAALAGKLSIQSESTNGAQQAYEIFQKECPGPVFGFYAAQLDIPVELARSIQIQHLDGKNIDQIARDLIQPSIDISLACSN